MLSKLCCDMQIHIVLKFKFRLIESEKTAWNKHVCWLQVIEIVGTLQLCRFLRNFLCFCLWAQRPQQNWLSIFSYSIVAFLDLRSQISRENSCLRNLNKLQITAFEGKCRVLDSWNHIGISLHFFISLTLITVTCSTHSQGLSSASLIALSLRRKNIDFSS